MVDDSKAAAYMLARLLQVLGQQATMANDGLAAWEAIQRDPPDMVISDIAMPEISGYELAQRVRQRPELQRIVLVALTGYGQEAQGAGEGGRLRFSPHKTRQHGRSASCWLRCLPSNHPPAREYEWMNLARVKTNHVPNEF